ncbi:MAG: hypothetical protein WCC17_13335 [Candidatus Nitrosopolaris sp.]
MAKTVPAAWPRAPESGVGPRSASVTGRPDSQQTEATSEPVKPPPMTSTCFGPEARRPRRRLLSSRVRRVNTPSRVASSWLNLKDSLEIKLYIKNFPYGNSLSKAQLSYLYVMATL